MVEKIISKDTEACRAGSLGEMEELRIGKELKIKSGNYTELHREGTELHRGNPENYKQMSKKSQWLSVVLCGTLCNKKTALSES